MKSVTQTLDNQNVLKNIKSRLDGNAKGEKGQNYALAGRKQSLRSRKQWFPLIAAKQLYQT